MTSAATSAAMSEGMSDGMSAPALRHEHGDAGPLARYADRAVPRYTSYPTAPHFHAGVGPDAFSGQLGRLAPDAPVSLYLHVPYCRQVCWYCGCNMKLAARYAPLAAYVETLLAEIDLVAATLPARMAVSHLHWGGGTPTALSADDLERVMSRLHERFDIREDAELAIESDPRTVTPEMIARIGALGFTRASFGVQEFDPAVQDAINRVQPPDMVADCVAGLRDAGVSAINFDLIYGLPRQTRETIRRTAELCVAMAPSRIALFGYAHVPWMAKKQRLIDETTLPDAAARAAQAADASAVFADAGFEAIGVDHFAAPHDPMARAARTGGLRRNFQGYTTDVAETLIGFGATSISKTPEGYVQNLAETGAWAQAVKSGALPVAKGVVFSGEDRLRAEIIERVMCDRRVDLAALARRRGAPATWWRDARAQLETFERDGLVRLEGEALIVTEDGRPFVRVIASAFDQYLGRGGARHSRAV